MTQPRNVTASLAGTGVMAVWMASSALHAAQPESPGCTFINTDFLPPPGYSGWPGVPQVVHPGAMAFTAGETLTLSVDTVNNPGVTTVLVRDHTNQVTVVSLVLNPGASASGVVPENFTGFVLALEGGDPGVVSGLAVFCTAAPDPVVPPDPEDEDEVVADVGTDPGQASRLVTMQTSTAAVAGFPASSTRPSRVASAPARPRRRGRSPKAFLAQPAYRGVSLLAALRPAKVRRGPAVFPRRSPACCRWGS